VAVRAAWHRSVRCWGVDGVGAGRGSALPAGRIRGCRCRWTVEGVPERRTHKAVVGCAGAGAGAGAGGGGGSGWCGSTVRIGVGVGGGVLSVGVPVVGVRVWPGSSGALMGCGLVCGVWCWGFGCLGSVRMGSGSGVGVLSVGVPVYVLPRCFELSQAEPS
jgi:hypothetical protein